jgi:hypothetical protein
VLSRLGSVFCCVALLSLSGGHWAVLQTVAWARMLRDYSSEQGSVSAGISKTFGGEAPCAMCKEIAKKRQEEKKEPAGPSRPEKRPDLILAASPLEFPAAGGTHFSYPPDRRHAPPSRGDAPPGPVPRTA